MKPSRPISATAAAIAIAVVGCCFVLAAAAFPGGGYNPFLKMLSALGRTEVRQVTYPWCGFLFAAGMFASAAGVLVVARQRALSRLGAALNVAGLVAIALMPENVSMIRHNAGCWLAAVGGALMLIRWFRAETNRFVRWFWLSLLVATILFLGVVLALNAGHLLPFVPWAPTAQKLVLISFAAWIFFLALRPCAWAERIRASVLASLPVVLALVLFVRFGPSRLDRLLAVEQRTVTPMPVQPLSAGELEDLAWIDHVTAPLSADEERAWWGRPRPQYSIFAKRYNIAFAGYAAAALGQRGDAAVRAQVGRILGHCIDRMLKPDVWGYSQSKNYWGRKPWVPDPCYRENVMYTGHLLHLLAYYELFTGDKRYHRDGGGGWDFVWKDGRRVHYDVEKLIAVTVEQMRKGPNGGIACEPGLMFFACNNHPHIALAVFKALGYGDWSADARRWEKWALDRLVLPTFGGGALGLVYHARSNIVYPRGQNAFDGWSLLWYEAWTSDRRRAKALWREASARIDHERVETAADCRRGRDCCDPEPVSSSVTAVFLAAAARACDDAETAERLEATVDRLYERREGGRRWLALDPEWRIGATAMRITSRALAGGSRFRTLPDLALLRPKGHHSTKGEQK